MSNYNTTTAVDNVSASRPSAPIGTFILKVASRCNLNCRYCYMYNMGDRSYLTQPRVMSKQIVDATVDRVRRYCAAVGLRDVEFIFHGGEPLLAGRQFFYDFVATAKERLLPSVTPAFNVQTNGLLLNHEWFSAFVDLQIGFGISLDGPKEINDANRIDHAGEGSYDRVRRAIDSVVGSRDVEGLFGGLLTVVSLDADATSSYREYRAMGVPSIDFLLPDRHHDSPPARIERSSTPYADWLIDVFEAWFADNDPSFRIRLFENILDLLFGSPTATDYIGGTRNGVIVVETNGGIEPVDVLKICGDRFTKTTHNVLTSDFLDAVGDELIAYSLGVVNPLCDTCKVCELREVCGGGYLPHRYSARNRFDNPSVYCGDLTKLITHIRNRLLLALPQPVAKRCSIPQSG